MVHHIMAYTQNTSAVEQNPEIKVCRCHTDDRNMIQDQQIYCFGSNAQWFIILFT